MTDADLEQARAELDLRRIFTPAQLTQIIAKLWRAIQHSDDCDQSVTLVFKHGHFAFVNGTENEKAIKPTKGSTDLDDASDE
jgi:hypothetical protein